MINLKKEISTGVEKGTTEFFVSLPMQSKHSHRLLGTARRIHFKLREKILELVQQDGITNIRVIKKLLKKQVKEMCEFDVIKPDLTDRAYHPLNRDIINCIHSAIVAGKHSQLDLVQLEKLVEDWKEKDSGKCENEKTKFFLRKCSEEPLQKFTQVQAPCTINEPFVGDDGYNESGNEEDNSTCDIMGQAFLFVHQEPWQQRLMLKYGNTLCLLDATYKTTKYSLPLFLLCVRSNSGYIPVAEFIVEQETSQTISEALKIISSWNSMWSPPFFMIDYSAAELNAILAVFPNTEVYLCEFHREQSWTRWIRNGMHYY